MSRSTLGRHCLCPPRCRGCSKRAALAVFGSWPAAGPPAQRDPAPLLPKQRDLAEGSREAVSRTQTCPRGPPCCLSAGLFPSALAALGQGGVTLAAVIQLESKVTVSPLADTPIFTRYPWPTGFCKKNHYLLVLGELNEMAYVKAIYKWKV